MTGDTKKKIFKKPSRKTLLISGAVVIVCAAAWLIFGQGIVGDKNVEFKQLSKDDVPKSIETEVIPEYRELERALGCLIAVSYTHLDVYKRQEYSVTCVLAHFDT